MLKIDGAGTGSASTQEEAKSPACSNEQQKRRRSSKKLGAQVMTALHSLSSLLRARKPIKHPPDCSKSHLFLCPLYPTGRSLSLPAAANMSAAHGEAPGSYSNHSNAAAGSKVSELARLCAGLGMAPPDFSFIGKRQVTACTAPARARLPSPSRLARSHLMSRCVFHPPSSRVSQMVSKSSSLGCVCACACTPWH